MSSRGELCDPRDLGVREPFKLRGPSGRTAPLGMTTSPLTRGRLIMHRRRRRTFCLLSASSLACAAPLLKVGSAIAAPAPAAPNIVHIIADDLGWGDVGFNGQTKIKTPNLNSLRSAGLAMSNAYCPASVCAPTRAALLTGFHNGHSYVDRNGGDISTGFRTEDFMLGQM